MCYTMMPDPPDDDGLSRNERRRKPRVSLCLSLSVSVLLFVLLDPLSPLERHRRLLLKRNSVSLKWNMCVSFPSPQKRVLRRLLLLPLWIFLSLSFFLSLSLSRACVCLYMFRVFIFFVPLFFGSFVFFFFFFGFFFFIFVRREPQRKETPFIVSTRV